MRKSILFCGIAAISATLAGSPARADIQFMNINFSGDTNGSPPATNTTISYPITQPYSIGGYGPDTVNEFGDSPPLASDGTILVGSATGISKGAIFTPALDNNQIGAVFMDTEYNEPSQTVKIAFDLNVITAPSAATLQTKTLNNTETNVGIIAAVNTFQNGGPGFDFAAAPTGEDGGVFGIRSADNTALNSFFDYSNDEAYHIELDADYDTGTVNAYVNGVLEGSNLPMQAGIVPNAVTDESFFFVNPEPGDPVQAAFGNITASVPEPASLGLLAGCATLILRRRRA